MMFQNSYQSIAYFDEKVRRSPKSLGLIIWRRLMCVQNVVFFHCVDGDTYLSLWLVVPQETLVYQGNPGSLKTK